MLTTRLWMGGILVALTAGMLLLDVRLAPWYPFLAVFVIGLSLAACRELISLLGPSRSPQVGLSYLGVSALAAANWIVHSPWATGNNWGPWSGLAGLFIALVLAVFLWEISTSAKFGRSVERMALTVWIIVYLGLLPCCLAQVRWLEFGASRDASTVALALAIFVPKCCDIGAYCTGRLFGRHAMTPVLSPKKTWEGAAGGLVVACVVAYAINRLGPAAALPREFGIELAFGVTVGLAGMFGDLAESLVKRDCQRKDASQTVPGFGGVLDVVDSVILVGARELRLVRNMDGETSITLTLDDRDEALGLFGSRDQFLRMIRDALAVRIIARGDVIHVEGSEGDVDRADRVFQQLRSMLKKQGSLSSENVRTVLAVVMQNDDRLGPQNIAVAGPQRHVRPRTDGQGRYVQSMRDNDLVFCIGPAGTGKTYLAVGMAVDMLRQGAVKRIVLVRPAVEAGERLAFLPGDIVAKINPYIRPLFDALNEMMEPEQVKRYMENDIIEIAPLAYMRGRTLNQAVIILDEGQNTTVPQMKMFLTRMGNGSKIIVTGDITQVDLPRQTRSGMIDAVHRLKEVPRIGIVYLNEKDIVRHPLVQLIVQAYEDDKPQKKGVRISVPRQEGPTPGSMEWPAAASRHDQPLLRRLGKPAVLVRLAAVWLTTTAVTAIAFVCGPPFAYRVGEIYPHDLRARLDFEVINHVELINHLETDGKPLDRPIVEKYPRGLVLVPMGQPIQDRQLALLEEEHLAFQQNLPNEAHVTRIVALFFILSLLAGLVVLYVARFQHALAESLPMIVGVCVLVVLTLVLSFVLSNPPWHGVFLPLTVTAMVLTLAYNPQFALLMSFSLAFSVSVVLGTNVENLLIQMGGIAAAVLLLRNVRTRTQLVEVASVAGLAYLAMTLATGLLTGQTWSLILADCLRHFLCGSLAGFLLTGLLPVVERCFNIVTDISLLELADGSHPLLQELVRRAPGTYTHSITVATLAEAAADAISANPLLVRVGSYFHDIGKMLKPHYFIENQTGENRHDMLEPALSTLVIIGHVKDGVALAQQYGLPGPMVDFIAQHHGTTLVEYFYREAMRLQEVTGGAGDLESVFRYPGPKPQTRENGILMLADAVESTSRSLANPTPGSLNKLVHDLLMKRLLDGQFEESGLTLTELHLIEESLSKSLIALFHARIRYPEAEEAYPKAA